MFCVRTEVESTEYNDVEKCCLFLINHGANLNGTSTGDGYTPLHMAIWSRCNRISESLIKAGANINAFSNATACTPLHYAFMPTGLSETDVEEDDKFAPLMTKYLEAFPEKRRKSCAMRCYFHSRIAEFMIKNRADVNIPGNHKWTPFHEAIKNEEG